MAVQLILQRAGGGTINLYNKNAAALSTVIRAEQKISLLGEDVVNVTVESAVKIPFSIGDKTTVFGREYKINRLPKPKKTGNRLLTYDIELEGVQYDLARATYDLNIDTTNNELQDVQADTLTGNLHRFVTVLLSNANRVFPGKWVLGEYPTETEDKTLTFGEMDNCLSVLQRLCSEYNTEFDIEQVGGVNTINFGKAGQIFPYTFEYGKGKGLYELERQNVSSANIVTRLKVLGGTRNVSYKYRANRLCLPGKTKGQSFIEKPDAVARYGIWEATKYFDNIYPSRTGTITGVVSGSVLKFVDNTMNFDLNEKEADGVTTKYLLDGVAAKIHFNSGNLSGYEFELQSYDHATKTFTLKPFKDERDETFPSEKSEAFQFAAGDKYVILDIALPQTYIDDAEVRLAAEGNTYYDQNSQPKVQYSLAVAEEFLKSLSGVGGTTNIFQVGDYLPVKDTDIDVDKSVRIQGFTRNLIDEYKYQLTISDTVTTNITNRVISELIDIDKVIKINNLKDPAKARRDWRSAQELLDMVFDTEGDYYSEKIKPNSIETSMLAVGAKSTQFGLVGTVIQANYNGNKNSVNVKGGTLSHYAIEESGRNWTLADGTTTLTGDSTPYYIYAKCQKVGTAGSIIFSTSKITVDEDPSFYHFLIGVVNSVDPTLNVRSVALTYGFTTVNGKFIRTGRIQSNDGLTYFDLDLGEIGGKITFRSTGGTDEDLAEILDGVGSDIQDTQAAANAAALLAQQAIDEAEANVTLINQETAKLQQQIDGEVSNWFYPYSPTLANYPASDWTTNTIKDRHIGDTFTNTQQAPATDAGKSWRFVKNGTVYSWTQIADSDAVLALQKAALAQSTADGKSTTYLIQPTKYKLGDTWVLNADRTINGTAYKQGEILTATQDSTTFVEAHWIKRVRYTDDTAVENLQIGGRNLIAKKYIREWNDVNSNITLPGTDADGDYLAINQANLYQYVGGLTAYNDIFQGKIKYKENTQYALKVRWRLAASQSSSGLYLRFKYTDGTSSPWLIVSSSQTTVIEQSLISAAGKTVSGINCTYGTNTNRTLIYDIQLTEGNKQTAGYIVAPEDVQAEIDNAAQIAADAQAKANISKAITDKFGTTVDGGLIGTVMILLRELNSLQETAGLSGIQGALMNNPAFWAGGTSAKALALIQFLSKMSAGTTPEEDEYGNLAKITLLHDGAAKIGDFIIEKTGRISMIDPSTAKQRLVFSTNNIPSAAELEGTATGSGSATNAFKGLTYPATEYTFPNKINVTKEGSDIKVETFISFSWDTIGKEFYGWATFNLFLDRNGSEYMHVDSAMVQRQSGGGGTSQDSKSISKTIQNCPSGEYSLRITIVKATVGDEPANIIGSMNQSTLSWQFTGSSIKRIEFGLDGLFALWDNFLFHISQHTGLTIKGGVNMPGILAAGRVNSAGSMDSYWRGDGGVITSVRTSNPGLYTITHGLGRTNYFPQITPIVEDVNFKISAINANNFVVDTYHVNAHTRWNSAFIFTIFGNNYG